VSQQSAPPNFWECLQRVTFYPLRLAVTAEIGDRPAQGVMVEYFMLSKMMSALPRIAPDVRIFQIGSLIQKATYAVQQRKPLLDHLVGAQQE
jgi:hypothetical protein